MNFYSCQQVVDRTGLDIATLHRHARQGVLKSTKIGGKWLLSTKNLKEYLGNEFYTEKFGNNDRHTIQSLFAHKKRLCEALGIEFTARAIEIFESGDENFLIIAVYRDDGVQVLKTSHFIESKLPKRIRIIDRNLIDYTDWNFRFRDYFDNSEPGITNEDKFSLNEEELFKK